MTSPGRNEEGSNAPPGAMDLKRLDMVLTAPDDWRRRASTAAGLLSAGAAALLAGLLFSTPRDVSLGVQIVSTVAAFGYIVSICAFLYAAAKPNVPIRYDSGTEQVVQGKRGQLDDQDGLWSVPAEKYAELLYQEAKIQSKPLARLVHLGAITALASIVLAFVGVLMTLFVKQSSAFVEILSTPHRQTLSLECPSFDSRVHRVDVQTDGDMVAITIPHDYCSRGQARLALPAAEVVVMGQR